MYSDLTTSGAAGSELAETPTDAWSRVGSCRRP